MSPATMDSRQIEEHAAQWLLRQEEASWTQQDQVELELWLDESTAHRMAFYRLEYGWRKVDRLAALKSPLAARPSRRPILQHRWAWPAAIAASILVVLTISGMLGLYAARSSVTTYATIIGERQTVPLSDGSQVELNTNTKLRTAINSSSRQVWLDQGEAYFEVKHDPAHPFVIYAGPRRVTVLGTKFSVRRDGDRVEVAVVEGRVRVDATTAPAAFVTPGLTLVTEGRGTLVTPKSIERVSNELSWRSGQLTFDQTTLSDAADEFNRYNRKQLIVMDSDTADMRIGGSFEAENVDAFVRLLQTAYGLKVVDDGKTVKISE